MNRGGEWGYQLSYRLGTFLRSLALLGSCFEMSHRGLFRVTRVHHQCCYLSPSSILPIFHKGLSTNYYFFWTTVDFSRTVRALSGMAKGTKPKKKEIIGSSSGLCCNWVYRLKPLLLGFSFCPSALVLSMYWPHSLLLQTDLLHMVDEMGMEMH